MESKSIIIWEGELEWNIELIKCLDIFRWPTDSYHVYNLDQETASESSIHWKLF